jgi:pSer/pThr/pTyr-binding forkhead associated (FHA) protein
MADTRVRFTVVSALLNGHQVELDPGEPISVGRTWDNRLALDHKSVSRRHARIDFDGTTFRLRDLQSHNGTQVNNAAVTEQVLQPGDTLGFGEILVRFEPLDHDTPPAGSAALPAVLPSEGQDNALARPLGIDDVFARAGATETIPKSDPQRARRNSAVLYALLLTGVIVVGGLGIWYVDPGGDKPLMIAVQLKQGELLPVNVGRRLAPSRRSYEDGLSRIDRIDSTYDERVAEVIRSRFSTYIVVRGRNAGTTDVTVHGPPHGKLIVRVLVRGSLPDPPPLPPTTSERIRQAQAIFDLVIERRSMGHGVESATASLKGLRRARDLLSDGALNATLYQAIVQEERRLKALREDRFKEGARQVDIHSSRGDYELAVSAIEELVRIYNDPEEPRYHVLRAFHQDLVEDRDYAARRKQE